MIRLTGTLLLSVLCVLPLKAEQAPPQTKATPAICPSGSHYCPGEGCVSSGFSCSTDTSSATLVPLPKKKRTIYLIQEGTVFKCKNEALVPILDKEKGTYTCSQK